MIPSLIVASIVAALFVAAFVTLIVLLVGFNHQVAIASSEDVGVRHADAPSQTDDSPGSAHGFRPNHATAPGIFANGRAS